MRRSIHAHGTSELKARPPVLRALGVERRRLGAALRSLRERVGWTQEEAAERIGLHVKHLQRLERGRANATLATLVSCSLAFDRPLAALFAPPSEPFERLPLEEVRPFRDAIPLLTLRAVAGRFGAFQQVEPEAWVRPLGRTRPAAGLFVAQVLGESMNRRIPGGAFCVFRAPAAAPLEGKLILAQHRGLDDPEQGGQYTVKRYRERGGEVRLEPLSASRRYRPLAFRGEALQRLSVLAEVVEVLH